MTPIEGFAVGLVVSFITTTAILLIHRAFSR